MSINIVVGAGQAGAHAAVAMRRAGFSGRIVLIGDESTMPYERPPLSKGFIASPDEVPLVHFFEPATYASERIEVITGVRVEELDLRAARLMMSFGGSLPFDRLILATGSRPRRPLLPGAERLQTMRTYGDAVRLRAQLRPGAHVVCIGAGVIGLEIASSARARGCTVAVVDVAATVMSRSLDPRLAALIEDLHARHGVDLRLSAGVAAIEPDRVVLADGTALRADLVVAGIGVERNVDLAVRAGIETRRGIVVDGLGWTSAADVLAAGEVAEFHSRRLGTYAALESWRHAQDHGAAVGRTAAGGADVYDEVPWFWSDQFGVNFQFAGETSGTRAAHLVKRGDGEDHDSLFILDAEGRVVGAMGRNAARDIAAALRLIRQGRPVDPARLADPSISLQRLVADGSRAALASS